MARIAKEAQEKALIDQVAIEKARIYQEAQE